MFENVYQEFWGGKPTPWLHACITVSKLIMTKPSDSPFPKTYQCDTQCRPMRVWNETKLMINYEYDHWQTIK